MNKTALKFILILILLAGTLLFALSFMDFVVYMGHNIPQPDMTTDYIYGLTWAMFLAISIFFWPVPARDRQMLMWGWFAKILVTLGFMLLYENNYGLDAYGYFDSSTDTSFRASFPVIGNGTNTIYYLTQLHSQIFPKSYHMMKVSFSLVGFIAIYLFYRAGVRFLEREDPKAYYALALFPSVVFWSSILGKDPIILLGIAAYAYGVVGWSKTNRPIFLAILLLGVLETMYVRIWLGQILLAPLVTFALHRMRGLLTKVIFLAIIAAGFFIALNQFKESFSIQTQQDLVATSDAISHSWGHGGSGQVLETRFTSVPIMIGFLPLGIFTALFRPLPGEIMNPFAMLAGLENLLLLIMLFQAIKRTRLLELTQPLVMWAIALILTWASVYGFTSYQNLGSAARFRLQILPILLGTILYLRRKRLGGAALAPGRINAL